MKDHSENTLRAAIKCLRDVVTPAVDADDPQATEQLRLTIDFLEFLRTRMYDIHPRLRYELGHQITVAQSLQDDAALVSPRAARELTDALEQATEAHRAAETHTSDLQLASDRLWSRVRGVLREARSAPAEVRERITTVALAGLDPLLEMESAWYLPFGFEPDPSVVPELRELLRPSNAEQRS
jgi:hypothetical protein